MEIKVSSALPPTSPLGKWGLCTLQFCKGLNPGVNWSPNISYHELQAWRFLGLGPSRNKTIWIFREGKFGKWLTFRSTESKSQSLHEVLMVVETVGFKETRKKTWLIQNSEPRS